MSRDTYDIDPMYRMPATLGPAAGPRNMPYDVRHLRFQGDVQMLAVTALTEKEALRSILPDRCTIVGEPLVEVVLFVQKNLGWLAGRGYNFLLVRVPVRFEGESESFDANFAPVLWENMADPILTGREEIGMPKLFASLPDPKVVGSSLSFQADWEGFRFFEMDLSGLADTDQPLPPARPTLLLNHFPKVGELRDAQVQQMIRSYPTDAPAPEILQRQVGSGSFAFHPARWLDMPTQYTYINALASLPLIEFRGARSVKMKGIGDLAAYRPVA